MPLTFFPKGLSTATASHTSTGLTVGNATAAGDGDLDVKGNLYVGGTQTITGSQTVTGALTGANGSVYGARSNLVALGSQTVTLSSALYVVGPLLAPFTCYPEIVYLQDATANITRSIRIVAGVDSTGTALATLTIGSATSAASTLYTTVGGTVITQGSQFTITSAVTATANTGYLTCNLIAVAS